MDNIGGMIGSLIFTFIIVYISCENGQHVSFIEMMILLFVLKNGYDLKGKGE